MAEGDSGIIQATDDAVTSRNLVLLSVTEPPTRAQRAAEALAQARSLAREAIDELLQALLSAQELAKEIEAGEALYSAGVREAARQCQADLDRHHQNLASLAIKTSAAS